MGLIGSVKNRKTFFKKFITLENVLPCFDALVREKKCEALHGNCRYDPPIVGAPDSGGASAPVTAKSAFCRRRAR
jgi:hypothetical protein